MACLLRSPGRGCGRSSGVGRIAVLGKGFSSWVAAAVAVATAGFGQAPFTFRGLFHGDDGCAWLNDNNHPYAQI